MKRDLLGIGDLTSNEIENLFSVTAELKKNKGKVTEHLKGKSVGLVFQKPSNRTRVSFEVGVYELGGKCIYLGPEEINLGKRETTSDVAQTLSRYLSAVVARVFSHKDVVDLAKYSSIPVINGLCDLEHPCQALTDIFSIQEKFGKLKGITVAYIGDGNNVSNSLVLGCAKMGLNMNIATPKKYAMANNIIKTAKNFAKQSGVKIEIKTSPRDAVNGADVIYTDTWVSMGQEAETKKRLKDFKGFQIDAELASKANKNYIFMHCLPAHRGQEVTEEIIDGKHSIIFDQAENRLHVQKAILIFLLGENK